EPLARRCQVLLGLVVPLDEPVFLVGQLLELGLYLADGGLRLRPGRSRHSEESRGGNRGDCDGSAAPGIGEFGDRMRIHVVTRSLSTPAGQVIGRVRVNTSTLRPVPRPALATLQWSCPGAGANARASTWSPAPQRSHRASAWLRRYRSPSPFVTTVE